MKCTKFSNAAFVYFILASSILSANFAFARRIKDNASLTPEKALAEQGYYISPEAGSELSQIKMVSFDWGGVLSEVINNKELADKVKKMFESLASHGIRIVIVSEGGVQEIKNQLELSGLRQYITSIYQAYSQEPTQTKRAILEDIARRNGYGDNQIVHFEDTPDLIEKISFEMGNQPHIAVVGVVGRKKSDIMFEKDARRILGMSSIAIANLETGLNKILKLLGLGAE